MRLTPPVSHRQRRQKFLFLFLNHCSHFHDLLIKFSLVTFNHTKSLKTIHYHFLLCPLYLLNTRRKRTHFSFGFYDIGAVLYRLVRVWQIYKHRISFQFLKFFATETILKHVSMVGPYIIDFKLIDNLLNILLSLLIKLKSHDEPLLTNRPRKRIRQRAGPSPRFTNTTPILNP